MVALLFILLFLFLLGGMEIALALGAAAVGAMVLTGSLPVDLIIIPQKMVGTMARAWPLLTIPMFIMLGEVFKTGGLSQRLVDVANIFFGRLPGGLAIVDIVASYFFAGISGSASAEASALGGIMIPAMVKQGYSSRFATVVTICASTLGPIVPPSILVILIAWVTDLSVSNLFLAGYIPGFLTMMGLIILSYAISRRRGYPRHECPPFKEAVRIIVRAFPALLTPLIIVAGIVSGRVTIVESSSLALIYSLFVAAFVYRELSLTALAEVLRNTVRTTAFIGLLLSFATVFSWLITFSRLPIEVADLLVSANFSPAIFLLLSMVIYLILGCFLNAGEIVLMAIPVLYPASRALNIDPIHFAMISALSMVIGNVTPPVGLSLFIGCAISGDRIEDLVGPLVPYVITMVLVIVLLIFYPDPVLWLPKMFGYKGV
jgi:tripartite ATP-independent transporter DctM subunit